MFYPLRYLCIPAVKSIDGLAKGLPMSSAFVVVVAVQYRGINQMKTHFRMVGLMMSLTDSACLVPPWLAKDVRYIFRRRISRVRPNAAISPKYS